MTGGKEEKRKPLMPSLETAERSLTLDDRLVRPDCHPSGTQTVTRSVLLCYMHWNKGGGKEMEKEKTVKGPSLHRSTCSSGAGARWRRGGPWLLSEIIGLDRGGSTKRGKIRAPPQNPRVLNGVSLCDRERSFKRGTGVPVKRKVSFVKSERGGGGEDDTFLTFSHGGGVAIDRDNERRKVSRKKKVEAV